MLDEGEDKRLGVVELACSLRLGRCCGAYSGPASRIGPGRVLDRWMNVSEVVVQRGRCWTKAETLCFVEEQDFYQHLCRHRCGIQDPSN
jgi:hypothetical protein